MPRAWLSLGSNIDRRRNITSAVAELRRRFGELVVSRVYESPAVGFESAPFYNLVVGIDTGLQPQAVRRILERMEWDHGRRRGGDKFVARTLDIDLLTYGDRVSDAERLPRDEIGKYAFVLRPLSEVAGDERHPVTGRSYRAMWTAFDAADQPLAPVDLPLDP